MATTGRVSVALQAWREGQRAQIAQVLRNSVVGMPYGQRIRNLRAVLGWSQREAARHLEVAVRTVIRHERRESFWLRLPMLEKLRTFEAANAEEIIAYLAHAERSDAERRGPVDPPGELQGGPSGPAAIG
jgi:ribosome-binding protein aMBF1 (putative translation factor)